MILYVTFTDGSNPWVSLPTDRHTVAKLWRRWMKNHPDTARPIACDSGKGGAGTVRKARFGPWYVLTFPTDPKKYPDGPITFTKYYQRLGNALAALERMVNI